MTANNEKTPAVNVNPVTRQLIRGSLRAARLECELLIERTAMSAFIREKKDYQVSFLDRHGHEIYGDSMGSDIVRCVWDFYPVETMAAGDLYWYNDPYLSRGSITHTPDMVFLAPVFFEGEAVAYCHSFAHFWDLGGSRPGSIGPANTEIFHDGTLVPPIKIIDQGKTNDEAYRIILRNSRYPDLLEGDTRALMAAANRAQERLLEMFGRFGKETTLAALEADQADTAAMVREKALELIPEGTASVREYMDHDGVNGGWHSFHLELNRENGRITLDSTQSDDQAGGSINFMASDGALGAYFGQYFHQYDTSMLSNHGLLASIDDVKMRQGSILQPDWPAALGCRAHTFTKLKSSVRALLAEATGGKVMAGSAVYVIAYWRMKNNGEDWLLCTDGIAVGHGARPFADGLDAIYSRHNENYPGEFMEMEYPLRMERYAIGMDSGGPGKFRGGCGIIRDVRILADEGTFGLRVENNLFPTWGVSGGMGGGTSRVVLNPGTPQEKEIRPFSDDNVWKKGDLVRVYTAGGGGWGDPLEREPDVVLDDVLDGFVSIEAARDSYGVVIDPSSLVVDQRETETVRADLRKSRGPTKLFHRFEYYDTAEEELTWVERNIPR
ncbi:MAG: hydantoinase B/oxoprolinase family protein [SAR202 cluster bacterium]|nr:hydantoinase B/oxoprolinase family protein [SAR202 cluster bacterium]HCP22587.1 methylhydantoinase [Dehalococcoidia bacterium]